MERDEFEVPTYKGRYFEPFLGGGAVFFFHRPEKAILSDLNPRLIETYQAIKEDWKSVYEILQQHHELHCRDYYYKIRSQCFNDISERAAHFLYLNRACWNGLYRENLKGEFNVPIGTKTNIVMSEDNFSIISNALSTAELICSDFESVIDLANEDDFIFVDPPYTTAHNFNGFVKYNEKIFSWDDQRRVQAAVIRASKRGAKICMTNADHHSIRDLYKDIREIITVERKSVIAASSDKRKATAEVLIRF